MARMGRQYVCQILPDEEEYHVILTGLRMFADANEGVDDKSATIAWGIIAEMYRLHR